MTRSTSRWVTALVGLSLTLTACGNADPQVGDPAVTVEAAAGAAATDEVAPAAPSGDAPAAEWVPTVTHDVVLSRDPFDPVREPPAVPAGEGADTDGTTEPGVPGGVVEFIPGTEIPVIDPVTGVPVPGTGPACTTKGDVVCDGISVLLLDVTTKDDAPVAIVRADTVVMELEPGTTFLERFRLVSIDGTCASFLYGDEPFKLCEGDQSVK